MKKIVFTLAAMMSMTLAFAEGESNNKANVAVAGEAQKFDMNFNKSSLARALELDYDEIKVVNSISDAFADDMKKVGEAQDEDRDKLYKKAIKRNLSYMHTVLSYEQYAKYLKLLNTTLNNRGLNK